MPESHDPQGAGEDVCPRCHGTGIADDVADAPEPEEVIVDRTLPSEEGKDALRLAMREKSAIRNRKWIMTILLVLFTLSMVASPVAAALLPEPKETIEEVNKARELIAPIVSLIVGYYFGAQSRE
ncbi:hypothetical protein ACIBF7_01900 [Nonomuraea sp. NPDC050478]|uniref:hypothetical protein n=1 Tax=unclassified Nonomuraea TaxID=2593643 RepID=UPI0011CD9EFB|nr:hypothetical protein [Nonomuraea sp. C10]TXK34476.1 hypothetical protein FR742_34530 [Nonomuraea sp. C10]